MAPYGLAATPTKGRGERWSHRRLPVKNRCPCQSDKFQAPPDPYGEFAKFNLPVLATSSLSGAAIRTVLFLASEPQPHGLSTWPPTLARSAGARGFCAPNLHGIVREFGAVRTSAATNCPPAAGKSEKRSASSRSVCPRGPGSDRRRQSRDEIRDWCCVDNAVCTSPDFRQTGGAHTISPASCHYERNGPPPLHLNPVLPP